MTAELIYYLWAALLILACVVMWVLTCLSLPGNWGIAALAGGFAWLYRDDPTHGLSWGIVTALLVLAAIGELVEFAASAAGAARHGASRRAMVLAAIGTFVGSLAGAIIGVPIPIIGPVVAAVGGGALGAFGGAYLGEIWKGKASQERMAVSSGALVGRILGSVAKLLLGIVMVIIVSIGALF